MPRGRPGSGDRQAPRRFLVQHQSRGWAVKQGVRWRVCEDLTVQVTVASVAVEGVGPCLAGVGVVRTLQRGAIVITA